MLDDGQGVAESSRDDSFASSSSRCSTPDPEAIEIYEDLMASLLPTNIKPVINPGQVAKQTVHAANEDSEEEPEGSRSRTKAEKQNAKKKRRKERERMMKAEEAKMQREILARVELERPLAFRLFSSLPMQEVTVVPPKEDYPLPSDPRLVPLPPTALQRIRRYAFEAAVEYPGLGAFGSASGTCSRKQSTRDLRSVDRLALPSLLLGEISPRGALPSAKKRPKVSTKPGLISPVPLYDANGSKLARQKRARTRRKRRSYEGV